MINNNNSILNFLYNNHLCCQSFDFFFFSYNFLLQMFALYTKENKLFRVVGTFLVFFLKSNLICILT